MSKNLISSINQVGIVEKKIIENGGELTPELEKSLILNEMLVKEKVDAYAYVIENLKERSQYWDEKAALLKKYARTCNAVAERMRGNLKNHMLLEDVREIAGKDIRFTLQNTQFTLDINESLLPPEYFQEKVIKEINKEKIKKAILDGHEIPGVQKIEGHALRVYPNHSSSSKKRKRIKHERPIASITQ